MKITSAYILSLTGLLLAAVSLRAQERMRVTDPSIWSTVIAPNNEEQNNAAPSAMQLRIPPCTTAPNDNYANAITLTIGASAITGATCGSLEAGEATGCNPGATQSVWYKVTATATTTYVILNSTGSCYIGAAIWPATGLPTNRCTMIDCQAAAYGPAQTVFRIAGTIGTSYAVQVTYGSGGPCGTEGTFDIRAANSFAGTISNPGAVNTCSTPTPGCYFTFTPTLAQVQAACPAYPLTTQTGLVNNQYFSFTTAPTNSNVLSFQNILQSTCGAGNVQWFFWRLFSSTCNLITCGDLGNLQNNVACNTNYILEYMWEELPCSYTQQWPYQYVPTGTIGCGALPVEILNFTATQNSGNVFLSWTTASESNNAFFEIERGTDLKEFYPVAKVNGAGNSSTKKNYSFTDHVTASGIYYYKLKQTDFDGTIHYYETISVNVSPTSSIEVIPNPASNEIFVSLDSKTHSSLYDLELIDARGVVIMKKIIGAEPDRVFRFDVSSLAQGVYAVRATSADEEIYFRRFVKN